MTVPAMRTAAGSSIFNGERRYAMAHGRDAHAT
jgi:hypothetical protein